MGWDLATIRSEIKNITGRSSLEDSDLNFWVNVFYRNELPILINPVALQGVYLVQLVKDTYKYSLPSDIRAVFPPIVYGDRFLTVYKNPTVFYQRYPTLEGDEPATGAPDAVLSMDVNLWVAPVPDDDYQIIVRALYRPDELTQDTDKPVVEAWGEGIAYGAAGKIYARDGDYDSAKAMFSLAQQSLNEIRKDDVYDYSDVRAYPSF